MRRDSEHSTDSRDGVVIRPAGDDDCPLILSFIKELAEYERLTHEVVADVQSIRQSLFGSRPSAEVIIAECDGQPAGFALFFHNYSTFRGSAGIYLEDLFVRPDVRGRGIGRALLARLARIAGDRRCARLEWAVLDWNDPAIQFYRKLGAQSMDEWTVFRLTDDALERLGTS